MQHVHASVALRGARSLKTTLFAARATVRWQIQPRRRAASRPFGYHSAWIIVPRKSLSSRLVVFSSPLSTGERIGLSLWCVTSRVLCPPRRGARGTAEISPSPRGRRSGFATEKNTRAVYARRSARARACRALCTTRDRELAPPSAPRGQLSLLTHTRAGQRPHSRRSLHPRARAAARHGAPERREIRMRFGPLAAPRLLPWRFFANAFFPFLVLETQPSLLSPEISI